MARKGYLLYSASVSELRDPQLAIKLRNDFASATTEVTEAMNEQFLALLAEGDVSSFDFKIASAIKNRTRAKKAMLDYIKQHGW